MKHVRWIVLLLVCVSAPASAEIDRILGVESGVGVPTELTGEQAGVIIGTGTSSGEAVSPQTGTRVGSTVAGEYVLTYRDPTVGLVQICEVGGRLNYCNKGFEVLPGKTFSLTTVGVPWVIYDGSTGRVTKLRRYQRICGGDLVGVNPATGAASHIWNKSPLDTAPTANAVTGTNRTYGVATFPDSDGDYGVQITCELPAFFDGTIDAVVQWKTTGTGNARFQFKTKCYASDATGDAAFNTAFPATAAAGTSGRINRLAVSGITATGCNALDILRIDFLRNRTEGSDTLNAALDVERVTFWAWGQ